MQKIQSIDKKYPPTTRVGGIIGWDYFPNSGAIDAQTWLNCYNLAFYHQKKLPYPESVWYNLIFGKNLAQTL